MLPEIFSSSTMVVPTISVIFLEPVTVRIGPEYMLPGFVIKSLMIRPVAEKMQPVALYQNYRSLPETWIIKYVIIRLSVPHYRGILRFWRTVLSALCQM